ncbi:MAG: hypothetical protein ISR43_07825 [Acidimicrobiia bacterium]|nr:hypothetical protein [Actinomycetota bacterium]MBL6925289.1 hypothetical protein [Acidimicrobiia bacterium]MBL6927119.1 hypothetical protein [Acidimicrobiia bacterium]
MVAGVGAVVGVVVVIGPVAVVGGGAVSEVEDGGGVGVVAGVLVVGMVARGSVDGWVPAGRGSAEGSVSAPHAPANRASTTATGANLIGSVLFVLLP